jgi:hypothetical protein
LKTIGEEDLSESKRGLYEEILAREIDFWTKRQYLG